MQLASTHSYSSEADYQSDTDDGAQTWGQHFCFRPSCLSRDPPNFPISDFESQESDSGAREPYRFDGWFDHINGKRQNPVEDESMQEYLKILELLGHTLPSKGSGCSDTTLKSEISSADHQISLE